MGEELLRHRKELILLTESGQLRIRKTARFWVELQREDLEFQSTLSLG